MRDLHWKILVPSIWVLILVCGWTVSAGARDLFVALDGDDAADGLSWQTAWRTPGRAFGELAPGDVLTIGDGRYSWGGAVTWRGTREAPIEVRAHHRGRTLLDGGARVEGWERAPGLRHTWRARVPGEKPVLLASEADSRYVLHRAVQQGDCETTLGCWSFDPKERHLYVRTTTGLPPDHHVIEVSFEPWGLLIHGGRQDTDEVEYVTLRGLVFKNYEKAGIRPNRAKNVLIEDCKVLQSGFGLELWYSSFTTVRRCEVWATYLQTHSEAAGIMFHGKGEYSLAEENVVRDVQQDGIRAYAGGSKGTRFLRNLVVGARDPMYFKGGDYHGFPDRNVVVGGRWFGSTSKPSAMIGANTLVGVSTPLKVSQRDLIVKADRVEEARFVDPAYDDYRLQADSPHRLSGRGAAPFRSGVTFVSTTGDDRNDGGSVATAWRTVGRAVAALRPGQTLYVLPGTYDEGIRLRRGGTAEERVVIRAHGKQRVVLSKPIQLRDAGFVSLEGFEVRGSAGAAVELDNSPDCKLRRIVARDSGAGIAVVASPRGTLDHALLLENRGLGLDLAASPGWEMTNTAFVRNQARQLAVAADSTADTWLEGNAYDAAGAAGIGRWGGASAEDLEGWRSASGQDAGSVAGAIAFPGDKAGDFDVEPGDLLAGAGFLAATVGPGQRRVEAPQADFQDLEVAWVGAQAAVVSWQTPRSEERTLAWYGPKGAPPRSKIIGPSGTSHSVTLSDLEPDTEYVVRVGGSWRHPDLPPVLEENGIVELRDFAALAGPLQNLETKGERSGISRPLAFRTLREPPPARRLHVSTGGSDSGDGLTPESAWRTLGRAAAEARPGDEVVVEPGVYEEAIVPSSGGATPDRRIVYRSASWQPVVLSGSNKTRKWALRLRGRRHLTFQGFHFREYDDLQFGQVMLDGMNEDVVFRHCLFDGRGANSGGLRARYNSTNDVTIEDSAFHSSWRAISWYYGSLTLDHVVFDIGVFSHVYMHRIESKLSLHNSLATSAGKQKNVHSGHLIVAESAEGVRADHNRFFFQPYDELRHLYRVGAHPHKRLRLYTGDEGLEGWRRDTGNGRNTRFIPSPGFAEYSARHEKGIVKPDEPPIWLDAYRLAPDSPLRGAAADGADVGIRFPGAR